MDELLPIIRLAHVIAAVFWVGSVYFSVLILEPRLAALGPAIQQRVMGAIMPVVVPAMMVSAITVFVTGTIITLEMRAGRLDTMLTTGWGIAIMVGIVATVGAMAVGSAGLTPTGLKLSKLGREVAAEGPSEEQTVMLARLNRRMDFLSRLDITLVSIALATMPLARFV